MCRYYGERNDGLPLAFNFSFLWSPWDAAAFRAQVERMESLIPPGAQPTYVLSSHDAPRHRSRFDHPVHGEARARVAAMMLLTLRGTPFLYYGEEIGMRDGVISPDRTRDPLGKRFAYLGRDPERTPMQWDASASAGFTAAAEPWLPLAPEHETRNVAAQLDDPRSLLALYRRLIRYRRSSFPLLRGSYRSLGGPPGTFVYERAHDGERVIVALNFADEPRCVRLEAANLTVALSTDADRPAGPFRADTAGALELAAAEGVTLETHRAQ
jgi:alpha-glucosidase